MPMSMRWDCATTPGGLAATASASRFPPTGPVPTGFIGTRRRSARPVRSAPSRPGVIFNFENQFDVWEDWPGGTGCAWIESFLVTEAGIELMSKLPRTIRSTDD